MDSEVASLKHMIGEANRIVAFTGAGTSAESGIPDFRSPTGIWSQASPIDFDKEADLRFVEGLNVFLGENGTDKANLPTRLRTTADNGYTLQ